MISAITPTSLKKIANTLAETAKRPVQTPDSLLLGSLLETARMKPTPNNLAAVNEVWGRVLNKVA